MFMMLDSVAKFGVIRLKPIKIRIRTGKIPTDWITLCSVNFFSGLVAAVWVLGVLIALLIPGSLSRNCRAGYMVGCPGSQLHDVFLGDRFAVQFTDNTAGAHDVNAVTHTYDFR